MKSLLLTATFGFASTVFAGNQISEDQQRFVKQYAKQKKIIAPEDALINTSPEPDLAQPGFYDLYNGKNLDGWVIYEGDCTFEAVGEKIVGKVVQGSPSTYLSTEKHYTDFILTAELYWEVNSNSGLMLRGKLAQGRNRERVVGPQVEMEGFDRRNRGWSGAIYGQGAGGWFYPLWLDAHADARKALIRDAWNRVTVEYIGNTVKTWINGVPAAQWVDEKGEYPSGYVSLQVHSGKQGEVHFRNIKILELD